MIGLAFDDDGNFLNLLIVDSARVSSVLLFHFEQNQDILNPFGSKGSGTHTKHQGGGRKGPTQYLENDKCYKHESLGGVKGILQGLKKFQSDITAFGWLPWQLLNHLVLFCHSLMKHC